MLFTNVNIFNGVDGDLNENGSVLVEGNLIKTVSAEPIDAPDAFTVDGEGRTLMPGLIDMHSHLCLRDGIPWARTDYDMMLVGAYVSYVLVDYLDQGFTTTRDTGCNVLGIAKGVNNGVVRGPRIFPSGGASARLVDMATSDFSTMFRAIWTTLKRTAGHTSSIAWVRPGAPRG